MTLHVFADALGLYPRYVVENIRQYGYMDENRFINLSEQVTYAIPEITQLADSIRVQCRWVTAWEGPMHRVVFHPYQASCYDLLHALKRKFPALRVGWVFWSFELYNRPSVYMQLLGPFSTQFYQNSKPFYHRFVKGLKQSWPGQVLVDLLYRVFDKALVSERLYLRSIRQVDDFYALLEEDFHYLQQVTPLIIGNLPTDPFPAEIQHKILYQTTHLIQQKQLLHILNC